MDRDESPLFVTPPPAINSAPNASEDEHLPLAEPCMVRKAHPERPKQNPVRRTELPKPASNPPNLQYLNRLHDPLPPSNKQKTYYPSDREISYHRVHDHPLPQTHADLFKKGNGRRDSPRRALEVTSVIDEGYAFSQKQNPRTPPQKQPNKYSTCSNSTLRGSSTRADTSNAMPETPTKQPSTQQRPKEQPHQRYGMFGNAERANRSSGSGSGNHKGSGSGDGLDELFHDRNADDESDEATETPAMQEVLDQEAKDVPRKPINLGNSVLGTPKGGVNSIPTAPMVHNSPAGKADNSPAGKKGEAGKKTEAAKKAETERRDQ